MRRTGTTLMQVVLVGLALLLGFAHVVSTVRADASSGWLSQAVPAVQKITQLPDSQSPGISNRDCTQQTYTAVNPTTGSQSSTSDCFAQSTLGSMGLAGSPVLFTGTSLGFQLNPNYPYTLQPVPNQGMMLALTSAPVTGSYMHFYRDIRQHLTQNRAGLGGSLLSYTVNSDPDFSLRDRANAMLPTNALGTLSYSSNGSWMVVDTPGGSFIRVNLATFDVLPFAPSLNQQGDTSSRKGEIAISDDGKYAAIASDDYGYFKVYDLTTCAGNTNSNYSQPLNCQSRDYWPDVSSQLSAFKAIYSLRFINDDNISMIASYNFQSGTSYKAAKFTVTAPGKEAHSLDYLAIGDSYISGEGEFNYKAGTDTSINKCHLSPLSYPFTLGTDLFNQYDSIACSGAVTNDVINLEKTYKGQIKDNTQRGDRDANAELVNFSPGALAQLEFIQRYQPRAVTLSIGGNDIGFASIVTKCVTDNILSKTCFDSYDERMRLVKTIDGTYDKLRQTYQAIQQADPGVQLYIVGYPQVVTQGACGVNVRLNGTDITMAQNLIAYLDYVIQQAANSTGARYVDTQDAFVGHRLCEAGAANIAMNGVTSGNDSGPFGTKIIGDESFHPNVLGHQLLAQAILSKTSNMHQAMPIADTSMPNPSPSDPLAQALLYGYTPSGNVTPTIVTNGSGMTASVMYRTVGNSLTIGSSFGLAPNSTYQASIDNSANSLGTVTTDSGGSISVQLTVPANTSIGFHTVRVTGTNMAGQTVEIYSLVYVANNATDLNGDGIADTQSACFDLPSSGQDIDSDGIDDGCDSVIGDAPRPSYPPVVKLTGNSIYITRP